MDKIETKTGLNKRQWALYRYLKEKGDIWTTQYQIAEDLREIYDYEEDDLTPFHDQQVRHVITKDIRAINESDYIHKPILSGSQGIKIANSKEFDLYIGSHINSAVNRLKRLKKLAAKGSRDGQYRLKLSAYQKELYECFMDSNVSETNNL